MSEAEATQPTTDFRRPGDSESTLTGDIPDPYELALEDINPVSPRLFSENKLWDYFKRLREEDPSTSIRPISLADSGHSLATRTSKK